ncbi:hypothetical protein BN1708_020272, partial [Verticillium longisporum]
QGHCGTRRPGAALTRRPRREQVHPRPAAPAKAGLWRAGSRHPRGGRLHELYEAQGRRGVVHPGRRHPRLPLRRHCGVHGAEQQCAQHGLLSQGRSG